MTKLNEADEALRGLLGELMVEGVEPSERGRAVLWEGLEGGGLRGEFDRMALMGRLLEPDEVRSSGERRVGELMFARGLEALLEEEAGLSNSSISSINNDENIIKIDKWRTRRVQLGVGVAMAAAAAGLVMWPTPETERDEVDGGFAPRTAVSVEVAGVGEMRVEVMPLCVTRGGEGEAVVTGPDDYALGVARCAVDGGLSIAYRLNEVGGGVNYVAFFAIQEDGQARWYAPSPASPAAIRVSDEAMSAMIPIEETFSLSVNHVVGGARLYAIGSAEPIAYSDLRQIVAQTERWVDGPDASARVGAYVIAHIAFEVTP